MRLITPCWLLVTACAPNVTGTWLLDPSSSSSSSTWTSTKFGDIEYASAIELRLDEGGTSSFTSIATLSLDAYTNATVDEIAGTWSEGDRVNVSFDSRELVYGGTLPEITLDCEFEPQRLLCREQYDDLERTFVRAPDESAPTDGWELVEIQRPKAEPWPRVDTYDEYGVSYTVSVAQTLVLLDDGTSEHSVVESYLGASDSFTSVRTLHGAWSADRDSRTLRYEDSAFEFYNDYYHYDMDCLVDDETLRCDDVASKKQTVWMAGSIHRIDLR